MSHEVFDKLSRFREFQVQYAAFRTEQHLVTAPVMRCATTARLEAIDLERCRWKGVYRDEITAFGGLDALTAPDGPRVPLSAGSWPVAAAVRWSGACARTPC
jgi:hypothetical protein